MVNFNKDVESHLTTNYTNTLPLAGKNLKVQMHLRGDT